MLKLRFARHEGAAPRLGRVPVLIAVAGVLAGASAYAAPDGGTLVVVPPPAATPDAVSPPPYPYHPAAPIRPKATVRCEQDRLLTDNNPCGEDTAQPLVVENGKSSTVAVIPKRKKRCEMDRLLTDTTDCER